MKNILIDTGFWFGLYDSRDTNFNEANELMTYLEMANIIIPFPTIYETINTRFSKNTLGLESLEKLINSPKVTLIDDSEYKDKALQLTFESSLRLKKPYSLVDMILRLMLEDPCLKIDYLISFNPGDFWDVCVKRNIEILKG